MLTGAVKALNELTEAQLSTILMPMIQDSMQHLITLIQHPAISAQKDVMICICNLFQKVITVLK